MATIRLPGPGAASPRGAVRYARANRIPAIIILFLLVVVVAWARQKQAPTPRQAAGLAVSAGIVVLAAEVVPEVVVAFLGALLVVQAIESADIVNAQLDRLLGLLPGTKSTATLGPWRFPVSKGGTP